MLSWLSEDEMLILQILPDQSTDAKAKSRQGGGRASRRAEADINSMGVAADWAAGCEVSLRIKATGGSSQG